MRIKCAVCRDFDLCLGCFAAGAEVTPHKAHHAYRVVEEMSFPLNHPDWGVSEIGLASFGCVKEARQISLMNSAPSFTGGGGDVIPAQPSRLTGKHSFASLVRVAVHVGFNTLCWTMLCFDERVNERLLDACPVFTLSQM